MKFLKLQTLKHNMVYLDIRVTYKILLIYYTFNGEVVLNFIYKEVLTLFGLVNERLFQNCQLILFTTGRDLH